METELMRLMVVRPPEKVQDAARVPIDTPKAMGTAPDSVPSELTDESIRILEDWAATSEEFITDTSNLEFADTLRVVSGALREAEDHQVAAQVIPAVLLQVTRTRKWQDLRQRINDSLLAGKFLPQYRKVPMRELADLHRAIWIVEEVKRRSQATVEAIRPLLDAPFRLPPAFSRNPVRPLPIVPREIQIERQSPIARRLQTATENARLLGTLVDRRRSAIDALKSLVALDDCDLEIVCKPQQSSSLQDETCSRVLTAWHHLQEELRRSISNQPRVPYMPADATLRISSAAIERLSDTTKNTLEDLGLDDVRTVPLPDALLTLQDRITHMELSAQSIAGSLANEIFKRSDELEDEARETHTTIMALTMGPADPPPLLPPFYGVPEGLNPVVSGFWLDLLQGVQFGRIDTSFPELLARRGPSAMRPAGETDLYLIRQHIKEYLPGEISHIENMMAGEFRERIHRRRHFTEEMTFEEKETETEEERNLETTDRAELERETEQTIQEKFNAEGGIQVSASYGPVSIDSHGEISVERSKEESTKTAQKIAREVTEKARQKVRDRVLKRRERRIIQELEETNTHRFTNEAPDAVHRSGIYQWLDKVYRAEVFSYGMRTMYDILVPEPAAGLIAANRKVGTTNLYGVKQPVMPTVSPNDLNEENLAPELVRLGATEAVDAYPQPKIVGTSFYKDFPDKETSHNNFYAEAKDITFPDGFNPIRAWVTVRAGAISPITANVTVSVANTSKSFFTANLYGANPFITESDPGIRNLEDEKSEIIEIFDVDFLSVPEGSILKTLEDSYALPVVHNTLAAAVATRSVSVIAVTITVLCVPAPSTIAAWQRKAHAVLMAAYEARMQEWRDAQIRSSFSQGGNNGVQAAANPNANRKLERDELQRAIVEIIRNKPLDFRAIKESVTLSPTENGTGDSSSREHEFSAYISGLATSGMLSITPGAHPFPTIDLDEAARSGPEIRFLQQAFEWENMTYLFYPYFYGRPETWVEKVGIRSSADPKFEEFLKSGAARVQIPVRPGFKEAVNHYLMTGEPWLGQDEPVIGDELWLAFIDEERASLGDRDNETHHTDRDFDVVVPTSLVLLRKDDTLPRWERDAETGWGEI